MTGEGAIDEYLNADAPHTRTASLVRGRRCDRRFVKPRRRWWKRDHTSAGKAEGTIVTPAATGWDMQKLEAMQGRERAEAISLMGRSGPLVGVRFDREPGKTYGPTQRIERARVVGS